MVKCDSGYVTVYSQKAATKIKLNVVSQILNMCLTEHTTTQLQYKNCYLLINK